MTADEDGQLGSAAVSQTVQKLAAEHSLTHAESAVLEQLLAGLTPQEIADRQSVTLPTVRTHIARLHEKFGVKRTLDLVRLVMVAGRS